MATGCHSGGHGSTTAPKLTSSAAPQSVAAAPAKLRRYYAQRLVWHPCEQIFQCTSLTVPVDYRKPAGATLQLAVIRKPATGAYRGSLIANPGGPGASGLDLVEQQSSDFIHLTTHYDLVSFDPRGVGQSRPVRCVTSQQLDDFIGSDPAPTTAAGLAEFAAASKSFANACFARNGTYLSHVATIDEARDMDVLRSALGDPKLTYYGASYGTYLGAKYAQLFPTRIRAMVLDGAIDPTESTLNEDEVQAEGFETDLEDFLTACAGASSCPLGTSESIALSRLEQLISQVRRHPLPAGTRQLTSGTLLEGLAAGLYSPDTWKPLQAALGAAIRGDGSELLLFSDALSGRQPDGSYTNLIEANNAINCVDRPSPRSLSAYVSAAHRAAAVAPVFGAPIVYSSLTCAYWRVPAVEALHPVTAPGAPPILVIGTTRDPATPYVWAQALAHQLRSGELLTYTGDGHTAYDRGDPCVLAAVDNYVQNLQPPKPGTVCH